MLEEIPDEWEEGKQILEYLNSECQIRTPFYDLHELASELGVQAPPRDNVIEELREKGYIVSRTHFEPTGIRTDAPFKDVRQKIREESL